MSPESSEVRPYAVLAIASLAAFMVFLDTQVLFVAFADIRASFPGVSFATMSWTLSAYTIALAASLVPAGRMADRFGTNAVLLRPGRLHAGLVALRGRHLAGPAGRLPRRPGTRCGRAGPRLAGDRAVGVPAREGPCRGSDLGSRRSPRRRSRPDDRRPPGRRLGVAGGVRGQPAGRVARAGPRRARRTRVQGDDAGAVPRSRGHLAAGRCPEPARAGDRAEQPVALGLGPDRGRARGRTGGARGVRGPHPRPSPPGPRPELVRVAFLPLGQHRHRSVHHRLHRHVLRPGPVPHPGVGLQHREDRAGDDARTGRGDGARAVLRPAGRSGRPTDVVGPRRARLRGVGTVVHHAGRHDAALDQPDAAGHAGGRSRCRPGDPAPDQRSRAGPARGPVRRRLGGQPGDPAVRRHVRCRADGGTARDRDTGRRARRLPRGLVDVGDLWRAHVGGGARAASCRAGRRTSADHRTDHRVGEAA